MGSHTFDLPSIDLSANEPSDESQSESWVLAENVLLNLASAFPLAESIAEQAASRFFVTDVNPVGVALPEVDARYRTLVEQIPAVVFMAFLDKGIGEAYVSPQIESILGFSQEEC